MTKIDFLDRGFPPAIPRPKAILPAVLHPFPLTTTEGPAMGEEGQPLAFLPTTVLVVLTGGDLRALW